MCRWLAYQGEPIYLDKLVYEPEHSLVHQSLEARKAVTRVNADCLLYRSPSHDVRDFFELNSCFTIRSLTDGLS